MKQLKWFTYRQNNTGGSFDGPVFVCVQAYTAKQANALAEKHGIYFDGVEDGMDCSCCGDRWERAFEEDGHDVPSAYGEPLMPEDGADRGNGGPKLIYNDGTIKGVEIIEAKYTEVIDPKQLT